MSDNLTETKDEKDNYAPASTNRPIQRGIPQKRHSKPQDNQRAPRHGQPVCPEIRRRNKRTHQQIRRVCQSLDQYLTKLKPNNDRELKEKEISKALVSLVLDKAKAPKNSSLFKEIECLKGLITIFKINSLRGLEQLAQGKTAKVLVDTKKEIAYKLIEINEGEVGGTFPKEIRIRPEDNQILISGCKRHSLLKMLKAIEISNNHGGPLFTEVAGFTEDGDIIICQPYIKDLQSIDMFDDPQTNKSIELNESIKTLDMKPLGDIGSPFAISLVNDKYAIFDDLHGDNVLKTKKGSIYLVDSLATRYLTKNEINLLKNYLPRKETNREEPMIS
jgi:hypothetical protein